MGRGRARGRGRGRRGDQGAAVAKPQLFSRFGRAVMRRFGTREFLFLFLFLFLLSLGGDRAGCCLRGVNS